MIQSSATVQPSIASGPLLEALAAAPRGDVAEMRKALRQLRQWSDEARNKK